MKGKGKELLNLTLWVKLLKKKLQKNGLPEKKVNLQAAVDTLFDTKQPMKKQR